MIELAAAILCLMGCLVMLISTLGLFRFPDIYTRIHATGVAPSLGLLLLLLAAFLFFPGWWMFGYLVVMITINFLTSPLAAHLIARAAYQSGLPLCEGSKCDEGIRGEQSLPNDADS